MNRLSIAVTLFVGLVCRISGQTDAREAAHARTEFRITVGLPYAEAFPLFGAWAEQKWSPEWKPKFLYPNPPVDREGTVFTVDHGPGHSSVWTNTAFDASNGKVQYVFVLNSVVLTRIDIAVTVSGPRKTDVLVVYERTAIDPGAAELVAKLAKHDAAAAPEWSAALNKYAATVKTQ